ncbi:MAG: hypothetical protein WAS73_15275 [Defluviicoccus sp.]
MGKVRGVNRLSARVGLAVVGLMLAAVTPQAGERVSLNEADLDDVTAGIAGSVAETMAAGLGDLSRTRTAARSNVFARGVVGRAAGYGSANALGNFGAATEGSSASFADTAGATVTGGASADSPLAFADTRTATRTLDNAFFQLAVGFARSAACCDAGTNTFADGTASVGGRTGLAHAANTDSQGPAFSYSAIMVLATALKIPLAGPVR